jgi:hypothetical protein
MKVIFLDIDGVLNSLDAIVETGSYGGFTPIYKKHVEVMKYIIKHTDAKIVISSSWRLGRTTQQLQELLPMLPIIDRTENLNIARGFEIQKWLDMNKSLNIESFVILDDDTDMVHLKNKLVLTKYDYGLTYVEAIKAIKMLNGNDDSIWDNRVEIPDNIVARCYDEEKSLTENIIDNISGE